MNGWLTKTTVLIRYHCNNGNKNNTISQEELILFFNFRIMNWQQESVRNKQSINRNVPNQWLINNFIKKIRIRIVIDLDKISENGRNIYKWNETNQSILEIDFDRTYQNGRPNQSPGRLTFWRFGISKYHQCSILRNTFQCHWTRTTETPSFRIDGC